MLPTDGLCDYMYFCHLVVSKGELYGDRIDVSWDMFKAQMKNSSKTGAGIGFDSRYVTMTDLSDDTVRKKLDTLASENKIRHYGLLNVIVRYNDAVSRTKDALDALTILKQIQGGDKTRKTIVAIGMYDYTERDSWNTYKKMFTQLVESTNADTVIALSSTGWHESLGTCYTAPPSAINTGSFPEPQKSLAEKFPDLMKHASLVAYDVKYSNDGAKLGLSFELGTMVYELAANDGKSLDFNIVYSICKNYYVTSLDVVPCKLDNPPPFKTLQSNFNLGYIPDRPEVIYFWDDQDTIQAKVDLLRSSAKLRANMSWLLYDAHLGDLTRECSQDNYEVLTAVRTTLVGN
ncbi:hypothetical protein MTO96_024199 [Rhipicephalus appendiculatus]